MRPLDAVDCRIPGQVPFRGPCIKSIVASSSTSILVVEERNYCIQWTVVMQFYVESPVIR